MAGFEVTLEGTEDLQKQFNELTKRLSADEVEPLFLEGATTVADAARANAPKGPTGNLKEGIIAKLLRRYKDHPAAAIAAINYKKAPHAGLVEYGTSERIGGEKSKRYAGRRFGIMPRHPFFRPAWDTNKDSVLETILSKLKSKVEKT